MSRVRAVGVQYNPTNTTHHAERSCSQTTPELEYCIWLGSLSKMLQCQLRDSHLGRLNKQGAYSSSGLERLLSTGEELSWSRHWLASEHLPSQASGSRTTRW